MCTFLTLDVARLHFFSLSNNNNASRGTHTARIYFTVEKKWLLRALFVPPPPLLSLIAAAERRQEVVMTSLSGRRDGRSEASTDEEESDGEEAMRFSHLLLL